MDWGDRGSVNGYTDSIESAIYLLAREPAREASEWVETEIREREKAQQPGGLVENWYGDGNFSRTLQLYALMKSQGVRPGQIVLEGAMFLQEGRDPVRPSHQLNHAPRALE